MANIVVLVLKSSNDGYFSYHFNDVSNGKVLVREVSRLCERGIVVVAGGLWGVRGIGTYTLRVQATVSHKSTVHSISP